jgi:RNA polymerase sigma-54 factor
MALSAKLQLRQSQQLVMTPQLQQAIRLLQLSNMELAAFVDAELERNPLLERDDDRSEVKNVAEEREAALAEQGFDIDAAPPALDLARQPAAAASDLDADAEVAYPEVSANDLGPDLAAGNWSTLRGGQGASGDEEPNIEAWASGEETLREHLSAQLPLALPDAVDRLIGAYLVDLVDEAGYMRSELADVAEKLGAPLERVEAVLAVLQTFDPPGVCARDLKECLAIQLKERDRYDPMIARFLDALPLLAQHNMPALKRAVGCDMDDITDMIAEIRRLNPKPGLGFGSVDVQAVVPDVIVRPASDGSWIVEVNSETLPRVLVNRVYYARVTTKAKCDKDKDFLADCLQNANWLVKSLDQRARTILRVAEEIVRQQDRFLTLGVQYMRPLNLKTVADAIKMHESTVSRVTSNKYMATPRGIFELKYFFTSAIAAADGEESHSSEAVRFRIKTLIENEKPAAVLSDDRLVEILGAEGIDIARRTVAKYREALRIPSSVQRRREKRQIA